MSKKNSKKTVKKEKEYQEKFENPKSCFGKLFDSEEAECKKCIDAVICVEYQEKVEDSNENTKKAEKKENTKKAEKKENTKKAEKKENTKKADKKENTKKADKKAPVRKKDENGFMIGSKSGMIFEMLKSGKYTKVGMLEKLDKEYTGANNKTTLNLLLNDIQKPVGTYSASRGIKINTDEKGVLSIGK